jgi:hypothetical protein
VVQDTSAFAKFRVTFDCLVFRPFKGEVLDCIVTSVNKARNPSVNPCHVAAARVGVGLRGEGVP